MGFLPIIARELLVASRRKATFRVRWWATLIGTGATFICLFSILTKPLPSGFANPLFAVLAACAFLLSFLAGAFLSSDSLSEEKRGGTLGLLFLSNLKSKDIVLGKFSALFLNAFFSVLALLPVIGIPMVLGGLEFSEFSRVVLALLNMLFLSLAAGIWVSAYGGSQAGVVVRTFLALITLVCGLPLIGALWPSAFSSTVRSALGWASPYFPFAYAFEIIYTRQPMKFWGTLFLSHSIGWLFLTLASRALSQRWRDSGAMSNSAKTKGRDVPKRAFAETAMASLLGGAPITRWILWGAVGAWFLLLGINWGGINQASFAFGGAKVFLLLLKALAAIQACRFFSESRSTGALELLLCTPMRNSDIISAQWRKLRRIFLWPSITLVLAAMVSLTLLTKPGAPTPTLWNAWVGEPGFAQVCWLALRLAADFLAVGWFGMSLALTLKRPIFAAPLTILLVLIVPALFSWLDLVADMFFVSWGTTRLQRDFRDILVHRYQEVTNPAQELSLWLDAKRL
jgi:ABC-type transport system involved in multi-copper enzyme maturation permease subunit